MNVFLIKEFLIHFLFSFIFNFTELWKWKKQAVAFIINILRSQFFISFATSDIF